MRGKIIRAVGGFYFVHCYDDKCFYRCRARGLLRKQHVKPLAGDNCTFRLTQTRDVEGYVETIYPRHNVLVRPPVANVDQALALFALVSPEPDRFLMDRFLIKTRMQGIPTVIGLNKTDIASREQERHMADIYSGCGCRVIMLSVLNGSGLDEVRLLMRDKTTVIAGPSGAGKSSLANFLCPGAEMKVAILSRKTDRGRQTTRHTELFCIGENTFFFDTPGFSKLEIPGIRADEVKDFYPEFSDFEPFCRFNGCMHINEPDCSVRKAVGKGLISRSRYSNYLRLVKEIAERDRYAKH